LSAPNVSAEDLRHALASIGMLPGRTALVHSDAMVAAQFPPMADKERFDLVIEAVETALGPEGTLVMPAFSYSFTKGETFDLNRTPSTVGMLTEHFRMRPGVCRTADPIFSFAAKGPAARELCGLAIGECFGPQSVFAMLHRRNADIVCLGCSLTRGGTFVHYVEASQGVPYRYNKTFSGAIAWPDGRSSGASVVYYVRDLTRKSEADLRRLEKRLEVEGKLRSAVLGRTRLIAVSAADLYDTASRMLKEDPVSLIAEGAMA
jgi:aminoglycoside 3-N-acetyltransferase